MAFASLHTLTSFNLFVPSPIIPRKPAVPKLSEPPKADACSSSVIVKSFSLSKKIICYPDELSKAYKVKVLLARSLIKKPKILVCDNILDDLDNRTIKKIINALLNYIKKYNGIVILSTSNNKLCSIANKVITYKNSNIVKIKNNKKTTKVGDLL